MTVPGLDDLLAAEGLTPAHWQLLRALAFGPMDALDLRDVLGPHGGPVDVAPLAADLVRRGWVAAVGDRYAHTEDGAAEDARLADAVVVLRRRADPGGPS